MKDKRLITSLSLILFSKNIPLPMIWGAAIRCQRGKALLCWNSLRVAGIEQSHKSMLA